MERPPPRASVPIGTDYGAAARQSNLTSDATAPTLALCPAWRFGAAWPSACSRCASSAACTFVAATASFSVLPW